MQENETIKVCVRIPRSKKAELLAFAADLRACTPGNKAPGWDSKAIHGISKDKYGGLEELFKFQDWPEKGNEMMPKFHSHVKEHFGSIENFVEVHSQFDGKAFRTTNPDTGEGVTIKISATALTMEAEEVCKQRGLEKLRSGQIDKDGTVTVYSGDL